VTFARVNGDSYKNLLEPVKNNIGVKKMLSVFIIIHSKTFPRGEPLWLIGKVVKMRK
jgi:hypothetical protein